MNDFNVYDKAEDAVAALCKMYELQIQNLCAISQKDGIAFAIESPVYPLMTVQNNQDFYSGELARPDLFFDYYVQECRGVSGPFAVSKGSRPIPLSLINEDLALNLTQEQMAFRKINVLSIESVEIVQRENVNPIHWFFPERVDYSINRLQHYTGVSAEHLQNHIIFVNYQKYLPYFIEYGADQISRGNFEDIIGPGDISLMKNGLKMPHEWNDSIKLPQMPAYSLTLPNREGITLVNIGVGPSNAKTMCDHLAVLRPKFGLMLGHCGGLKQEHEIGEYIIGSTHSMIDFCSTDETEYSAQYYDEFAKLLNGPIHVGAVASVSDRNWELHASCVHKMLHNVGAIGIDMESAMLVKSFSECGIPVASFLCISDKPFHRQVRLKKMAENFYNNRLQDHFEQGMKLVQAVCSNQFAFDWRTNRSIFGPLFR